MTISLDYREKNNLTTVQSGGVYTLQLSYSISSTTGNASGVQAVINLPDNIQTVTSYVGTIHAPTTNFVFTNTLGAKKLTITFVDPVASGSTGVLEFGVVTNNFTTLNNAVLATAAEMTATGGYSSGVQNQTITVTAIPRICAQKVLLGGGALDNETRYRITVSNTNSSTEALGTLQSTNITLTDNLPTGTEFVSAKIYNISSALVGNGTESGGVITIPIPDLNLWQYSPNFWQANYYYVDIVVKYNAPTFSVGDVVTNTATVDYTPFGGTAATLVNGQTVGNCTADLIEATTLVAPVISANLVKYGYGDIYPGNTLNYQLGFANTGNVALENVEIIETIPANIRINQAAEQNGVRVDVTAQFDRVEYQTNLSGATWVLATWSGGSFVPVLPTGEYFTKLKFVLKSPFAAGASLSGYTILYFNSATEVMADEVVTNCIEWTSTTVGIPGSRTTCNSNYTLKPRPTTSKIYYYVTSTSTCSVNIGDMVTYNGTVAADAGFSDAVNPVFALLVPAGFSFVPGSEVYNAVSSGITTAPTLQIIPNYITIAGTVRDMYRWTFPSGTVLPYGKYFTMSVKAKATVALTAGVSYTADLIATASNASINAPNYSYGNFTDTNDWDIDGNTTETIDRANTNYNSCNVTVLASASMESIKWVKGQCDTKYTRYPSFGSTVPGGSADYRLVVKNTGNIPMKDIKNDLCRTICQFVFINKRCKRHFNLFNQWHNMVSFNKSNKCGPLSIHVLFCQRQPYTDMFGHRYTPHYGQYCANNFICQSGHGNLHQRRSKQRCNCHYRRHRRYGKICLSHQCHGQPLGKYSNRFNRFKY